MNTPISAASPIEEIAATIAEIAVAMRRVEASRLSRQALVALIHDQSKISKRDINIVLNNLMDLEKDWLKPLRKGVE